jgi:hypothetical protein
VELDRDACNRQAGASHLNNSHVSVRGVYPATAVEAGGSSGTGTINRQAAVAQGLLPHTHSRRQQQQQQQCPKPSPSRSRSRSNMPPASPHLDISARLSAAVAVLQQDITQRRLGAGQWGSTLTSSSSTAGSQPPAHDVTLVRLRSPGRPGATAEAGVGQKPELAEGVTCGVAATAAAADTVARDEGGLWQQQQQFQQLRIQQQPQPAVCRPVSGQSDLQLLGLIWRGSFGSVYKALWRGR